MRISIHRGTQQIGGSCIEVATENTRIILDVGQVLPSLNRTNTVPLPALPEVSGLYKGQQRGIDALFISHHHGDHVGLIGYIHPKIPVYIGEESANIFNMTARFAGSKVHVEPTGYFRSKQSIQIKDINVTPYLVDHSACDSYAFVIRTNNKCVVYSGDFRAHSRKAKATYFFLKNLPHNVDALLIEGTMMSRDAEQVETEEKIEQKAYQYMLDKSGPVFVLQSAVNIDRLVGMYRAAKRSNRLFTMDIFTANIVSQLSPSIPQPGLFHDVRVFYPRFLTQRMFRERNGRELMYRFGFNKISWEEMIRRKDYCMLIRDTMLPELLKINPQGAGLIYSLWGGYEKKERVQKLLRFAEEAQIDVIRLHTSGHADVKTLHKVVRACEPRMIIPIHTEYPERFSREFNNVTILHDGETLSLGD